MHPILPLPKRGSPSVVFHARGLAKVYVMDEIAAHTLRDIDLDIYEGGFVVLLGPPVPASRRCLTSLVGSMRRHPGKQSGATTISSMPTTPN